MFRKIVDNKQVSFFKQIREAEIHGTRRYLTPERINKDYGIFKNISLPIFIRALWGKDEYEMLYEKLNQRLLELQTQVEVASVKILPALLNDLIKSSYYPFPYGEKSEKILNLLIEKWQKLPDKDKEASFKKLVLLARHQLSVLKTLYEINPENFKNAIDHYWLIPRIILESGESTFDFLCDAIDSESRNENELKTFNGRHLFHNAIESSCKNYRGKSIVQSILVHATLDHHQKICALTSFTIEDNAQRYWTCNSLEVAIKAKNLEILILLLRPFFQSLTSEVFNGQPLQLEPAQAEKTPKLLLSLLKRWFKEQQSLKKIPRMNGTPLHLIMRLNNNELLEEFLTTTDSKEVKKMCSTRDRLKYLPLHWASHIGNPKMMSKLVRLYTQEQLRAICKFSPTPFQLAAEQGNFNTFVKLYNAFEVKFENLASYEVISGDKMPCSTLMLIAKSGKLNFLNWILEVDKPNIEQYTIEKRKQLFIYALKSGNFEIKDQLFTRTQQKEILLHKNEEGTFFKELVEQVLIYDDYDEDISILHLLEIIKSPEEKVKLDKFEMAFFEKAAKLGNAVLFSERLALFTIEDKQRICSDFEIFNNAYQSSSIEMLELVFAHMNSTMKNEISKLKIFHDPSQVFVSLKDEKILEKIKLQHEMSEDEPSVDGFMRIYIKEYFSEKPKIASEGIMMIEAGEFFRPFYC